MKFLPRLPQSIMYLALFAFFNAAQAYQSATYDNCGLVCAPTNCGGCDFGIKASYLYWNVQEEYLGFAIENLTVSGDSATPSNSKLKTHDRKWDSGFRLEASLSNNCNPIGCHFEWTYFKTTSNGSASGDPLTPTVGVTTVTNFRGDGPFLIGTAVNSTWKIDINEFAFDIDCCLPCSPCISFSPYLGLFGAVINQTQNISNSNIPRNGEIVQISVFRKNDFWGIGPRFGVGAIWNFTQQFSLVCDTNFAYLIGKINTQNNFQTINILADATSIDQKSYYARPMASGFVGLNWDGCICSSILSLSVGYEFQHWWNQWHASSNLIDDFLSGEGRWGDLSVNGLVASIGIKF